MMFELLLDVMDRFLNLAPHADTPTRPAPTRLFCDGAVPGTSCQATIAPSLRDISRQVLIRVGLAICFSVASSRPRPTVSRPSVKP
jgi:hypothetical protein